MDTTKEKKVLNYLSTELELIENSLNQYQNNLSLRKEPFAVQKIDTLQEKKMLLKRNIKMIEFIYTAE